MSVPRSTWSGSRRLIRRRRRSTSPSATAMIRIATTTATTIQRVCVVTAPPCHARHGPELRAPRPRPTNGPFVVRAWPSAHGAEALADHRGDAVAAHAHAVQRIGDLHRRLLVRDDDQLARLA